MNNGLMVVTSDRDIHADLSSEPGASAGDMIQVAHLDFNLPTHGYPTQLPLPEIFTMGNWEGEGSKTYDVRNVLWIYGEADNCSARSGF